MTEIRLIQLIAKLAPLLAPVPSAFFIGRSIYYHLLYKWHLELPAPVNLAIAIVAGLAIELLAISSIYLATSLKRWNEYGHVKKKKDPWEQAPFELSALVASVYVLVAIYLLIVLEAVPALAPYSAIAFPLLALVGAMNWALFQQHQDRLDRYKLQWNFRAVPASDLEEKPPKRAEKAPELPAREPDRLDGILMTALEGQPSLSYRELGEIAGIAKSTVGVRVNALIEAGLLAKTQTGIKVNWNGNKPG